MSAYSRNRPPTHHLSRTPRPPWPDTEAVLIYQQARSLVTAYPRTVGSSPTHHFSRISPPWPGQYLGQNQGLSGLKIKSSIWFAMEGLGPLISLARVTLPRFSSVQSHLFLSLIGARTLKMPVPYPPPNVEGYTQTRTPSQTWVTISVRPKGHRSSSLGRMISSQSTCMRMWVMEETCPSINTRWLVGNLSQWVLCPVQ